MTDDACGVVAPSWYALRVLSNRERSVERALRFSGFDVFLPSYSERSQWSDRIRIVERLLFPGYLFVRAAAYELPEVLALAGVISVLDSNLRPTSISDSEIENVRLAISSMRPLEPSDFVAGDKVTIKTGALRGVSGVVQKLAKGARLVVTVPMLNRFVAVQLDAADLAKN